MSECIHVDLGDGVIRLMEKSLLKPHFYSVENDHEKTDIQEYLFEGRVVHRSAHVTLKKGLGIEAMLGRFG